MIWGKRFGSTAICCAMLLLTGIFVVAENTTAKPTTATGTVEFQTEMGTPVNRYTVGETMYIELTGSNPGSGSNPRFIYRLYGSDDIEWRVEVWDASSFSAIEHLHLYWFTPVGGWSAVLSYVDSGLRKEVMLASDHVQVIGNERPEATIDSILPNPASQGETVTFTGHAYDPDGYIVSERWTSNLDGWIGDGSCVSSSSLSAGTHEIHYIVTDNYGLETPDEYQWLEITPVNNPPVSVIDDITPSRVAQGGYVDFMGSASDPDWDPIVSYRWERWTSVNGQPGVYLGSFGSTQDVLDFCVSSWSVGEYFIKFYAYDGEDWSAAGGPVSLEVYREWFECPNPWGVSLDDPSIDYWARVFERDVDGNGRIDSVNLFMDANIYSGDSDFPCYIEYADTQATFWIELQGFVFGDDYLDIDTGIGEVIPAVQKTNTGYYGPNQRIVLRTAVSVADGEILDIPNWHNTPPHTIEVQSLTVRGWGYLGGYFCSIYQGSNYLDDFLEIMGYDWNGVVDIDYPDWPPVGDETGIYEWMLDEGYPDTRWFYECLNSDINSVPTGCFIAFDGVYELCVHGLYQGVSVDRYWSAYHQGFDFGFWLRDDPVMFLYDDFNDGSVYPEWSTTLTGGWVDCMDFGIPGCDGPSMFLWRYGSTGGVSARRYFTVQTEHVYAEAKMGVNTEEGGKVGYFILQDSAGAPVTHVAFYNGYIRYYDGGGWRWLDQNVQYDADVLYVIAVDVDVTNQVYDIYVNDQLVKTGAAFYGSHDNVASVYFQAGWFEVESEMLVLVDDVLVGE